MPRTPHVAPAKDLYISDLWHKRRVYSESTGQPWMILSAEHGLVDPDQTLEPYDRYLESEPASYRAQWSRVAADAVIQGRVRRLDTGASAARWHREHFRLWLRFDP
jgi:hypothetical protein